MKKKKNAFSRAHIHVHAHFVCCLLDAKNSFAKWEISYGKLIGFGTCAPPNWSEFVQLFVSTCAHLWPCASIAKTNCFNCMLQRDLFCIKVLYANLHVVRIGWKERFTCCRSVLGTAECACASTSARIERKLFQLLYGLLSTQAARTMRSSAVQRNPEHIREYKSDHQKKRPGNPAQLINLWDKWKL